MAQLEHENDIPCAACIAAKQAEEGLQAQLSQVTTAQENAEHQVAMLQAKVSEEHALKEQMAVLKLENESLTCELCEARQRLEGHELATSETEVHLQQWRENELQEQSKRQAEKDLQELTKVLKEERASQQETSSRHAHEMRESAAKLESIMLENRRLEQERSRLNKMVTELLTQQAKKEAQEHLTQRNAQLPPQQQPQSESMPMLPNIPQGSLVQHGAMRFYVPPKGPKATAVDKWRKQPHAMMGGLDHTGSRPGGQRFSGGSAALLRRQRRAPPA